MTPVLAVRDLSVVFRTRPGPVRAVTGNDLRMERGELQSPGASLNPVRRIGPVLLELATACGLAAGAARNSSVRRWTSSG